MNEEQPTSQPVPAQPVAEQATATPARPAVQRGTPVTPQAAVQAPSPAPTEQPAPNEPFDRRTFATLPGGEHQRFYCRFCPYDTSDEPTAWEHFDVDHRATAR